MPAASPSSALGCVLARFGRAAVPILVAVVVLAGSPAVAEPGPPGDGVVRPEEGEIVRLYRAVLGRQPDRAGYEYWVVERIAGVPHHVVAESFLASREFGLRFSVADDAAFVDLVYHHVLGRSGDRPGVAYWLDALAGGLERTRLVVLFAESQEHRALTGTTLLPLPPFTAVASPVGPGDLPSSWRPGCPVPPEELRSVELDHVGFDGQHRRGVLVVNRSVADDVVDAFRRLYEARYPIERMEPIDHFEGDDLASMAANNTSGFNCRVVTGGRSWSRHAFGTAIDLNPVQNPYVAGRTVLPPAGVDHLDRRAYHPAMIRPGDVVTRAFAEIGWRWGGEFATVADYQHVERR